MSVAYILPLALATLAMAASAALAAEAANLVVNGDFAKVTDGKPDGWRAEGDASVTQTLSTAKDADGRPIARLVCTRYEHGSPSSHAMLAQVGGATLAKGKLYEFSCRLRAEGLRGGSVSVAISDTKGWSNCGLHADFGVGPEWKTCRRTFRATQDVGPTGRLQIWFTEPGTLEVADVRIAETTLVEAEFTDVVPTAGGKNLVPNGSFEVGAAGWSSVGQRVGWGNLARLHGRIFLLGGSHRSAFLRIPMGGDDTPTLYFDYYEPVVRKELRPLAASLGWIPVTRGAAYTLSCDMRASRDGVRAWLGVRGKDPGGYSHDYGQNVKLGTEWKRQTFTFKAAERYVFVMAGPDLEADESVRVDLDDIQLEKGDVGTPFEPRATVEFALQPDGVFVAGQPASVGWRVANHGATPARATFRMGVTDFEDKPIPWAADPLDVPAGTWAVRVLAIPREWKGFYRVRGTAKAGECTATFELPLAIVPPPVHKDTVLGINHAFATADLIRLAAETGVTWYRDWSLKWEHMEPERGQFHWELGDAQIDRVLHEGAHVLPLLPPFPSASWSSEAPANLPTTGYPGIRLRTAWGPKDPQDLAAFVGKGVERYKDRIHVWEFLNEPIYTDYALPGEGKTKFGPPVYTAADYVRLLGVAAGAMRAADPNCRIIGGIAGGADGLARAVIAAGALKHCDVLNLHFYPGARRPEAFLPEMDGLLAAMDAAGGRKPIWITEFSYYAADRMPEKPFTPGVGAWSEERFLESERECADLTVRFFAVMLSRGTEKIFIHSGASGPANEPNFECCLMDYGGAPRKVFPALAVLCDMLGPSPRAAGERRFGNAGYAMAFEAADRSVVLLWKDSPGAKVRVETPADLRRLDLMGRELPRGPVDLSTSPVYLVGPAGKAKEILAAVKAGDK